MEIGHLNRKRVRRSEKRYSSFPFKKQGKREKAVALLKEYVHTSTIHGVHHIFKEGETFCHSFIWAVLWIMCLTGAVYVAYHSLKSNISNPIRITVTNTQFPLERVWFPAVVLCPSNKMILEKANEYISLHAEDQTVVNDSSLVEFYKSLVMLQNPLYVQMDSFLEHCKYLLPRLANINITALMYHSLPKCEDLFTFCYWQGTKASCCKELFTLQRSEEGFCYSFNSLTSERVNSTCKYFDAHNKMYRGCELAELISYGPSTGLQVYFKILDSAYQSLDFTGGPKIKVQVFHPNDFPEPGIFNLIPLNGYNKLNVQIKPTVTGSTEMMKRLSVEERGCIFKEEVEQSKITRSYSQASCLMECRMTYMLQKCFCLPYYFNRLQRAPCETEILELYLPAKYPQYIMACLDESAPVCNSQQLPCIVNISSDLKSMRAFSEHPFSTVLQNDSKIRLSCGHCSPTCNEVTYDVDIELTEDIYLSNDRQQTFDGYIDIYYKMPGAIMYTRDVTYDFFKILANIGGIGGLFLGGSILSITEIIYWFSKVAMAVFRPNNKLKRKKLSSTHTFSKQQTP